MWRIYLDRFNVCNFVRIPVYNFVRIPVYNFFFRNSSLQFFFRNSVTFKTTHTNSPILGSLSFS